VNSIPDDYCLAFHTVSGDGKRMEGAYIRNRIHGQSNKIWCFIRAWTSDERTNHFVFFVGRGDGNILGKKYIENISEI
jgi:hypothetical protein